MIVQVLSPFGRFEPLADANPSIGRTCVGCGSPLEVGDVPSLVNGTPADEEEQAKADAGLAHTVSTELAHERCAYPD